MKQCESERPSWENKAIPPYHGLAQYLRMPRPHRLNATGAFCILSANFCEGDNR
jgi:hypothetical protein